MSDGRSIVAYVHAYVGMRRNAGGETTLHSLLKFLVKNGWTATVIVSQPYPGQTEYIVDGVNVIPQDSRKTILHWIPSASMAITHLDNSERTSFVGRRFRTPVVHLVHNDMGPTHNYLGSGCDLAIFNTEWVRKNFPEYTGLSCVVHPPVLHEDYEVKKPGDMITMVNMWPNKGSDIFYDLAKRFPDKKFLAIPGGYGEQDIRSGYDNVEFAEHTMDMRDIYSRTRLILMPSKYESYGRVAVEAAMSGIPSIVADTPGLREALGENGMFCNSLDDYAFWISRLTHHKSYGAASTKTRNRAKELEDQTTVEMGKFLVLMNGVADTGKLLRGW